MLLSDPFGANFTNVLRWPLLFNFLFWEWKIVIPCVQFRPSISHTRLAASIVAISFATTTCAFNFRRLSSRFNKFPPYFGLVLCKPLNRLSLRIAGIFIAILKDMSTFLKICKNKKTDKNQLKIEFPFVGKISFFPCRAFCTANIFFPTCPKASALLSPSDILSVIIPITASTASLTVFFSSCSDISIIVMFSPPF